MSDWPTSFDFDTNPVCQELFRPFIENQLHELARYDAAREEQAPDDITYIFHEHAERVAENILKSCLFMGLGETVANNMYWAVLPHDIGKCKLPLDVWDTDEKPDDGLKTLRRTHTVLGADMVRETFQDIEHPFKDLMIEIMAHHHEHIDGSGTNGLSGDQLSQPVRLAAIVEAYDGYRIWRPHFGERDISPPAVLEKLSSEKGAGIYDMDLLNAFTEMKLEEYKKGLTRK